MKINFVLPYAGPKGGIRVVAIYAQRLQQRGHQVFVVSQPKPALPLKRKIKMLLQHRRWPRRRAQAYFFAGTNVEHHILDQPHDVTDADLPDADVVVATWWATAEPVFRLAPAKGAKVYFVQDHEIFRHQTIDRVKASYRLSLRKIVVSQWLAETMQQTYGQNDVVCVGNGVDTQSFHAPRRKKQPRPTFGFLYSKSPRKGVEMILEAVDLARRKHPQIRLVGFGASAPIPMPPLIAKGCFKWNLTDDREIAAIYAGCDAWLFGSHTEGFGLPILEAMACRTPVIATRAGAAADLVNDSCGILLPDHEPQTMADAMVRFCTMTCATWQKMSQAAQEVAAQHDWQQATDRFESALMGAIEPPPATDFTSMKQEST